MNKTAFIAKVAADFDFRGLQGDSILATSVVQVVSCMNGKLFAGIGMSMAMAGIVVACAATVTQSSPFEDSLANFSLHMQRAAEGARQDNAESTISEFRLACEELRSAEVTAPKDEAMLVRTMLTQCSVVLAEIAMGDGRDGVSNGDP
ncbi:MAG: hypothetical protein OXI90_17615 [Gammaproteobacteria bacterium]|nr:hypothetical protein [Gammaproteobacteria bacterium]